MDTLRPVLDLLAKVMLYLNLNERECVEQPERSELRRKYRRLGPKLTKTRQRRLQRVPAGGAILDAGCGA